MSLQPTLPATVKVVNPTGPTGVVFTDRRLGQMFLVVDENSGLNGWLCYQGPEGQWVTLRKATDADFEALEPLRRKADEAGQTIAAAQEKSA